MAKVTLSPELQSISGKVGNMLFKTYRSGKVGLYRLPRTPRTKPLSPEEQARQIRFGIISRVVAQVQSGYEWLDEAARDRKKIFAKAAYHYDRLIVADPDLSEKQIIARILERFSATKTRQKREINETITRL